MATPNNMPHVVRDLTFLAHERLPQRGESEHDYFTRLVSEIRRHERTHRRERVIRRLLGRESPGR